MATYHQPQISIVIPVANEAGARPAGRRQLDPAARVSVVGAGGRAAETVEIAEFSGCRVLRLPQPQRARQMNLGAANAHGRILVGSFL